MQNIGNNTVISSFARDVSIMYIFRKNKSFLEGFDSDPVFYKLVRSQISTEGGSKGL